MARVSSLSIHCIVLQALVLTSAVTAKSSAVIPAVFEPAGKSPLPVLQNRSLLLPRQYTCDAGLAYCSGIGCCPIGRTCCYAYGYCLNNESETCCPNGPCSEGYSCCGQNHCYPRGGQCCFDERHCNPGYYCVRRDDGTAGCRPRGGSDDDDDDDDDDETTSSSPSPTPSPSPSPTATGGGSVDYDWYTWTVTWSYWSYYYVDVTIITSTIYETSTLLSVYATDIDDASSSLSEETATMSFYTPPSATSLASITDTSIPTSAVPTFPLPSVTFSPDGGSASAGNSRAAGLQSWWQMSCLVVVAVAPAVLMIWL